MKKQKIIQKKEKKHKLKPVPASAAHKASVSEAGKGFLGASKAVGQGSKAGFVNCQANALKQAILSFRNKSFLHALLFDVAFLISIVALIICVNFLINRISEPLLPDLAMVADLRIKEDPAYADAFAKLEPSVIKVLWQSFGIIVVAYLVGILLTSLFYSKAWSVAKNEHFRLRRMLLLNLEWLSAWLLLMIVSLAAFADKIAQALFIIEFLLFIYLDFVLRASYAEHESITGNFISAFKLFFSRIHHFLIYIIIVPIAYALVFALLGLFANIDWLFFTLFFLLSLLVLGFARSYAIQLVREVKRNW